MFQTFVDSLNNQIAAQATLINKLTIDTEQRIVLYKALEDSLKTAAQQDVAHKINTLGSQVDTTGRVYTFPNAGRFEAAIPAEQTLSDNIPAFIPASPRATPGNMRSKTGRCSPAGGISLMETS